MPLRILVNHVDAHAVGHAVEALRYVAGHRAANPGAHIGLLLNAATPVEMATWAGTADEVHAIPMYEGAEAMRAAVAEVPRDWDHVLDGLRRGQEPHSSIVPGFADWWPIADAHLRAGHQGRVGIPPQPPGYVPSQPVRLELPADARAAVDLPDGRPRIALLPAGSSQRSLYPSAAAWADVVGALRDRWPDVVVVLVGKLRADDRTSTTVGADEHAALTALPGVVDAFDRPLAEQLALVEACDVFVSTHSGFGMASLAVATPWLTISGGGWPEYFFNGVPFHSVMPPPGFGDYSFYDPAPVVEDDEGEGPRSLHVTRARIRADLDRIVTAAERLVEGRMVYEEAMTDHFRRLARLLGPRVDLAFSTDMVHLRYLPPASA